MTAPETADRPYASAFLAYAGPRPEVVCLTADLSRSCEVDLFEEAHPERFLNMGMAEQNMMGVAAGLAASGLVPFVHTFGVFATRRSFDQVTMAIGTARARVRIMGFLPGLTTPGGETHQAIDDVALMGAVPGMTVVDLADATDVSTVLPELESVDGPVYCRVLRGEVPVLFREPFRLGEPRVLAEGTDLCVVSASVATAEAARAVAALSEAGVSAAHLHVGTLRPIAGEAILEAASGTRGVITVENHLVTGGLGSAVAEVLAEAGAGTPLVRLGLRDYAESGSLPYLLEEYGLSARHVVGAAEAVLGESLGVRVGEREVRSAEGDEARQEAL